MDMVQGRERAARSRILLDRYLHVAQNARRPSEIVDTLQDHSNEEIVLLYTEGLVRLTQMEHKATKREIALFGILLSLVRQEIMERLNGRE